MKIRTTAGDVVGEVITNHSMTIYEACELAGIDAGHNAENEYDIDDLVMDYGPKKYRLYDEPADGTTGQDCGVFEYAELPERIQKAITARPGAGRWVLPALSDGDTGRVLDGLITVVEEI